MNTVKPNTDGAGASNWAIVGGASSRHAAVSHGVSTPDDSEFIKNGVDEGGSAESLFLGFGDMPSDFAAVSLKIREKCDASNPSACGVRYQIFKSDGTTALTNQLVKQGKNGDFNSSFTDREYAFTLAGSGSINKTSWDGALLKLEHFDDGSDGDDTEYNVSEIELSLNTRPSGVLVRLSWGRSPSPDVTGYVIKVVDNREGVANPVIVNQTVGPFNRMWDFGAEQGSRLSASVAASDGTFESSKSTANFTVPDLEPPLPVSGVSLRVVGLIND